MYPYYKESDEWGGPYFRGVRLYKVGHLECGHLFQEINKQAKLHFWTFSDSTLNNLTIHHKRGLLAPKG